MSQSIVRNIIRFVGIFLLQVLILQRVDLSFENFNYIHILVYPLAIFMLPISTPKVLALIISFVYGLLIDGFYNSPGVHTASLILTFYIRTIVLRMITPYDGYTNKDSPTLHNMGINWFLTYISIMYTFHIFVYFCIEAFSFVFIFDILLNTVFSLIPTLGLAFLLHVVFRAKY